MNPSNTSIREILENVWNSGVIDGDASMFSPDEIDKYLQAIEQKLLDAAPVKPEPPYIDRDFEAGQADAIGRYQQNIREALQ